ncbi:hypothetical protein N657DRAFT_640320 [Parathielavia appendiculata]|uniref:Uncharacterized protein n=1 Tax=Parathielavia appendiculata TaxID=2587402 RepID=A0AAN6UAW4_9PEZI|nr:hypothetical protein N657DRAFT_640320 [Parathielavia appendiculata]
MVASQAAPGMRSRYGCQARVPLSRHATAPGVNRWYRAAACPSTRISPLASSPSTDPAPAGKFGLGTGSAFGRGAGRLLSRRCASLYTHASGHVALKGE